MSIAIPLLSSASKATINVKSPKVLTQPVLNAAAAKSTPDSRMHAYYFDSFDVTGLPTRTAVIQAEDEDQAGRIAVAAMGRCLRVNVAQPIWGDAIGRKQRTLSPSSGHRSRRSHREFV
jgi:hypothetical protein